MQYEKLACVPRPGSMQETLCALLHANREERRAVEQLARMSGHVFGSAERVRWMTDYIYLTYPYLEDESARSPGQPKDAPAEVLKKAVAMGPYRIKRDPDKVPINKFGVPEGGWRNLRSPRTKPGGSHR